ncbi:hypothetical protein [Actinoplanes sp. NPDC049118]|uniref:hypothetical protein n=1 Tax=Actinoplanes sp. NPDC049118 TaxID=3155769 RepID=UPI0033F95101
MQQIVGDGLPFQVVRRERVDRVADHEVPAATMRAIVTRMVAAEMANISPSKVRSRAEMRGGRAPRIRLSATDRALSGAGVARVRQDRGYRS